MDKDEQNVIKVYTSNSLEPLYIKPQESIAQVSAINNRAEYFAEQTKKMRDEVKVLRDETKEYAEKNADVTVEDINYVKLLIDTKQPCGDYALISDIPRDVSELNNDLEFVKKSELQEEALPVQEGCAGMFLKTDGNNAYWENLPISLSLFDTILKDHVLTYEESKGLALQGTYVYKEALAGSRYGYPDFYAKCLEEFAEATGEETVNGITIKVHSNGHKFYNIVDKEAIDAYFEAYGFAWFYGVDIENGRIFLPRDKELPQEKHLYICVGNTANYEGITDVVNQGMEILEQVNQGIESRVKLDATNLNTEGKSLLSGLAMPSSKTIDFAWGASGAEYTAPANGYFNAGGRINSGGYIAVWNKTPNIADKRLSTANNFLTNAYIPAKKGDIVQLQYANYASSGHVTFIYAQGEV